MSLASTWLKGGVVVQTFPISLKVYQWTVLYYYIFNLKLLRNCCGLSALSLQCYFITVFRQIPSSKEQSLDVGHCHVERSELLQELMQDLCVRNPAHGNTHSSTLREQTLECFTIVVTTSGCKADINLRGNRNDRLITNCKQYWNTALTCEHSKDERKFSNSQTDKE